MSSDEQVDEFLGRLIRGTVAPLFTVDESGSRLDIRSLSAEGFEPIGTMSEDGIEQLRSDTDDQLMEWPSDTMRTLQERILAGVISASALNEVLGQVTGLSQQAWDAGLPREPRDIVDEIDALVEESMAGGEPRTGYSCGDPTFPRCGHCDRHWHGLPITERIAEMYADGVYDPEYLVAKDDSPVLCEGSEFIGPMRSEYGVLGGPRAPGRARVSHPSELGTTRSYGFGISYDSRFGAMEYRSSLPDSSGWPVGARMTSTTECTNCHRTPAVGEFWTATLGANMSGTWCHQDCRNPGMVRE